MATKLLGVKFQVAGVNEAQTGLANLKKNLNLSLKQNKQAVAQATKLNRSVRQELEQSDPDDFIDNYNRTVDAIRNKQYKQKSIVDFVENQQKVNQQLQNGEPSKALNTYVKPRFNNVQEGYFTGVGNYFGEKTAKSIDNFFRRLTGRKSNDETVEIGYKSIALLSSAISNQNKFLKVAVEKANLTKQEIKLEQPKQNIVSSLIDSTFLMPLRTLRYSFFEGIGANFGNQFGSGFSAILQKDLNYSAEDRGKVFAKGFTNLATTGKTDFLKNLKESLTELKKADFNFKTFETEKAIENLQNSLIKLSHGLIQLPASFTQGYRKGSVEFEGVKRVLSEIDKTEVPDLEGIERANFVFSGFAAMQGKAGELTARPLEHYADDKTAVFGADNSYTDLDFSVFGNKGLWGANLLGKIAQLNLKGFNPDAVKTAAQIVAILEKYPNLKVNVTGHSAGGFLSEEIQELMDLLGYADRVTTSSSGAPRFIGGLNNPRTKQIIGDNDTPIKKVEEFFSQYGLIIPRDPQNELEGVASHFGGDYLQSEDYIKEVLGEGYKGNKKPKEPKIKGHLIEIEKLYLEYLGTIAKSFLKIEEELNIAPDRLIAKKRKKKLLSDGAMALVDKFVNKDFKQNKLNSSTKTAVLVMGGNAGAQGQSGVTMANHLAKMVKDKETQYIGVENTFTDSLSKEQLLNNSKEENRLELIKNFAKVHSLGYNPDTLEMAAQVLELQQQNPEIKIKIAAYSAGGYVAEDLLPLLNHLMIDTSNIEILAAGTPELPGGISQSGAKKLLGENDPLGNIFEAKKINNFVESLTGNYLFPELTKDSQNIPGINSHDFHDYLKNIPELQQLLFGSIPNSKNILGKYYEIENSNDEIDYLIDSLDNIEFDPEIKQEDKDKKIAEIEYLINSILKEIYEQSAEAYKMGGGRYFKQEHKRAAKDLGIGLDATFKKPVGNKDSEIKDPWIETEKTEQDLINKKAQELKKQYKEYLQNLIEETKRDRVIPSQVIARDFAKVDTSTQGNFLQELKTKFNAQAKKYRQAVKSGQLELAQEEAETLLKLGTELNSLYSELENFKELDPEVKGKFDNYKRYITSVENEVLKGSGGKGKIKQGLPDIFEGNFAASQEDGGNFAEGFVVGILEKIIEAKQAGADLVEAAEQGIREEGEIKSPSRLAKRLGQWFSKGFGLGMASENLEQKGRQLVGSAAQGFEDEVKRQIDPDNIAGLLDTSGAGLIQKFGGLLFDASQNEQFDEMLGIIAKLAGKVLRLFVTFKLLKVGLDALGLGKFISAFRNLPEEALNAAIAVEALDNRILQMSGSAQNGAKNLEFITNEAARLNKNLTEAKENFAQVLGATRDSSLEGYQTENIYTAFASTAKANALSSTAESELFRSVRSMIGKNIVSQEEVRQEIGEKLGDFELSLAQAYGVSRPQLNEMISNRQIVATEALPKVAAVLRAKNDIYGDLDTGAAAAQRADNAIVSFRESVGGALLPLQKFGNNFLAGFFNKIAAGVDFIKPLVHGFFLALFANLLKLQIFGQSVQKLLLGLIKLLITMRGAIAIFAAEMALIAAAWKTWENVIKLFNSRYFPEINKDIEQLTNGMKAYKQAIDEARGSQDKINNTKLQLAEGLKLPENKIGDAIKQGLGSDYLNLDSLIRNPLNKLLDSQAGKGLLRLAPGGLGGVFSDLFPKLKTGREFKEERLKIDNSDLSVKGNQLLLDSQAAFKSAEEISKYDAQIAEIQSARLKILPGDQAALKASIEAEKEINQERDKELRILNTYQQTLNAAVNSYKKRLEDIEARYLAGEISESTYKQESGNLTGLLNDSEKKLKDLNGIISKTAKNLSVFQRRIRNSDERLEGFLAKADRQLQQQKADIINQGIEGGLGNQTIQIELEEAQQQDLQRRIDAVKAELSVLEKDLRSPELNAGVRRIKQQLRDSNIELNETSLQRIIDDSPVQVDREAAQGLLRQLRRETQLAGFSEQMAQSIQQNRNALIDYSRSIEDYFFNIQQQIDEAQLEIARIVNQIIQTQIRNRLQSALSPNANSFVNGLISSTQSLLDQAGQYAEKLLNQRGARIQLVGQKRSLQLELQDFARNISGASEALLKFENRLKNVQVKSKNSTTKTPSTKAVNYVSSKSDAVYFPVQGRTLKNTRVSSPFGMRKIWGGRRMHNGIDFAVRGGTKVQSTRDGIVRRIKPLADQTQVGIETAKGVMEWFIHLGQDLKVKVGDKVKAGQVIGTVAHTTNRARKAKVSTGDHLDYRVKVNGKWVDPQQFFKTGIDTNKNPLVNFASNSSSSKNLNAKSALANQATMVAFAKKTKQIANSLGIEPKALMNIMLFESAGTLRSDIQGAPVRSHGGDRARGLIQFMPRTARGLGTSDAKLAGMSAIKQLDYVEKYFGQFKNFGGGKLENLYAAVLAGNPLKVNASDGYVTARTGAQKMQKQFGAKAAELISLAESEPTINSSNLVEQAAAAKTKQLIRTQEAKLNLQDELVNKEEHEALKIAIKNTVAQNRRKVETDIKDKRYQLDDQLFSQLDLIAQYDYQNSDNEEARSLRGVNQAFSSRWREIMRQIQSYEDDIQTALKVIEITPELISEARTEEDLQIIYENEANAKLLLPEYKTYQKELIAQEKELVAAAEKAREFVVAQNKLKAEQETLNKRSLTLSYKSQLAEQRGSIESQRQVKIMAEELRLATKINELKQKYPAGPELEHYLSQEHKQTGINLDNINFEAQTKELDLEKRLLDYQNGGVRQNWLDRLGFDFASSREKKQRAVAQEDLRFRRELLQLEKEFADQPEKLAEFREQAELLNQTNLDNIEGQFKSVRRSVEDIAISATQNLFNQLTTNFFDGQSQRQQQLLQERVRYAEQLNQLNQQYSETPGHLAHLKNRARLLNEQKLDKINGEFNIFSRGVNLAKQALLEFIKQLAALAAKQAAAKFLSSFIGGVFGGKSSSSGGGSFLGAAFSVGKSAIAGAYKYGGTVPGYKNGGRIIPSDFTKNLAENAPGLRSALRSEGKKGVLAVFTPGEEILSIKTGEAGRYQALKHKLGANPLAKISNYAMGGTIGTDAGANILSGFSKPSLNLGGLNVGANQTTNNHSKTINLSQTIVTPNPDAFGLSADQRNQDLIESLGRA